MYNFEIAIGLTNADVHYPNEKRGAANRSASQMIIAESLVTAAAPRRLKRPLRTFVVGVAATASLVV